MNRLIRKNFKSAERAKMLLLYATLTEMDSDFNDREIKYFTKTIHRYSGLSKEFIPKGLKKLEGLGVLKIVQQRYKGKFKGKFVKYTPENIGDKSK